MVSLADGLRLGVLTDQALNALNEWPAKAYVKETDGVILGLQEDRNALVQFEIL